jgi:glycosyltransferase involved in cell wall biosynthesis
MKKLSIMIPTLGSGGAEKIIVDYCNYLCESGYEVCLVVNDGSGHRAEYLNKKIELHELGAPNIYLSIFPLLYYFCTRRPKYILSTLKEFNIYCLASNILTFNFGRIIIREANTLSAEFGFEGSFIHSLKKKVIKRLYPKADAVIALSRSMKEDMLSVIPSLNPNRILVAPNPVEIPPEIHCSQSDDHSTIRLVTVARLYPTKRVDLVIGAVPYIRKAGYNVVLNCVGEGEEKSRLHSLIVDLELEDVVNLVGYSSNPGEYLKDSDVFILASDFEGMPNSLLEAISLGVKSICRNVPGGGPEVVEGSGYGLVSDGDTPELLARDIVACYLLKVDDELVLSYLRENHNQEKVFQNYTDLLLGDVLQ